MSFKRYNSIENSYRQKFIDKIVMENKAGGNWCVKEKIHGANFQFFVSREGDEIVVKCGKRGSFLGESANFHSWQNIKDDNELKLMRLFDSLEKTDNAENITVYGEIFGGMYPHKDVKRVEQASKVQKGVFYSPDNKFMAFDLAINEEFLGASEADALFFTYDIPYLKNLKIGSLQECLDYSNEFQTTLPAFFGLPEIDDNVCEGVVIKPYNENRTIMDSARVILKNKNERFSEKQRERKPSIGSLPENIKSLISEASKYCTAQRLDNVLSKIGPVEMKDFGKIMGMLNKDVIEDFEKDNNEELIKLDKREIGLVNKSIGKMNAPLIKKYFMENI